MLLQDLGNSNYCVFVPRTQFERKTNALLVSDALNHLDINTYVNERNDICIDGYKISFYTICAVYDRLICCNGTFPALRSS